ncbi:MAG: hypothetical protein E6G33_13125 [Actinobacteria bacterium]|nr:MAG: hypothetical protein E6G33_13125 [Actinomycetota bacterium]
MRVLTLAAVCLSLLGLAPAAGAATPVRGAAPSHLHGFLLRADEPAQDSFARTPSFAWNPVAGAVRYQFQLATSSSFRESGIVYSTAGLTSPVAAPNVTLPWITGSPHALFARVRAIKRSSSTPWSTAYGFDMQPSSAPSPLPSEPGLLRWTPIEGADGYEVWLIDAGKTEVVYTNVLDEREFYTFHRSASWTSTVRWRIRALRADLEKTSRQNGLPAVGYGPWSPVYSSSNPAYNGGPITLGQTVSDVISSGTASSPAHRLMPAFTFSGDQAIDGTSAELFRVYVFTDRQCLNRVYTGAVVGGPAYAPRPFGPLSLPTLPTQLPTARASYLRDGPEPEGRAFDGQLVKTTESEPSATPTTALPSDSDSSSGSTGAAPTGPQEITITGNLGAPVDLWDTDWPSSGFYWTVVAVQAFSPGALTSSTASATAIGATSISAVSTGYAAGDTVTIGNTSNQETATIVSVNGSTLTLASALKFAHGVGEPVVRTGGNLKYRDLELPQDVCAAPYNRVARFGKNSEPSLTAAGELFASGLSPSGRLTAGTNSRAFYGAPLVAWTPALGATVYEVQWSKKRYPFTPQPNPQNGNALGTLTLGTSTVLPLGPGTWYYRVRGFNYTLPTGAQQMSWSDPAKIVVAKPRFKIVGGK